MNRPTLTIVITLGILGLLLLYGALPMGQWLGAKKSSQPQYPLGQVVEVTGNVLRQSAGQVGFEPLEAGPLFHLDRVLLERDSQAQLSFDSGYQITLQENTEVVVELWDPTDISTPVYINFMDGNFTLVKKGYIGQLYMVQDRQLFTPSRPPKKPPLVMVVKSPKKTAVAEETEATPAAASPPTAVEPEPTPELEPEPAPPIANTKKVVESPGVLGAPPDESEINQAVAAKAKLFQKCQANSLREQKPAKGQFTVGFKIGVDGRTDNVRFIQSNLKNDDLKTCILNVFRRVRLNPFSGLPIETSIPLNFE